MKQEAIHRRKERTHRCIPVGAHETMDRASKAAPLKCHSMAHSSTFYPALPSHVISLGSKHLRSCQNSTELSQCKEAFKMHYFLICWWPSYIFTWHSWNEMFSVLWLIMKQMSLVSLRWNAFFFNVLQLSITERLACSLKDHLNCKSWITVPVDDYSQNFLIHNNCTY